MATVKHSYKARGFIYIDSRKIGNGKSLTLSFEINEESDEDMTTCAGGSYASSREISAAAFSLSVSDYSAENLALKTNGQVDTASSASAREDTMTKGDDDRLVKSAYIIDTNETVTVSSATAGGGTVYTEGTDYDVSPLGIIPLAGGAVAATFYTGYTNVAGSWVQALMSAGSTSEIYFEGLNCNASGRPYPAQIFMARPGPGEDLPLMTVENGVLTISGSIEKDTTKGSNESAYWQHFVPTANSA
ncbi:MAG: hypothetical protein GY788_07505 [bacterium]|nr:hypothetical protein [bacterium]